MQLSEKMRSLGQDEQGLSTVEYVVLLVLMVAVAVSLWNTFSEKLTRSITGSSTKFDQVVEAAERE